MQWIAGHSDAISALTGLGTLAVWMIYLQVFVSSYRRQLRATLHITRGPGRGLEARCFLSNMSPGPVYIASVQVSLETARDPVVSPVTEVLHVEGEDAVNPRVRTRQGPLGSGETRDLGSFAELIRDIPSQSPAIIEKELRSVLVEIVGLYGSEDLPVGAHRCFIVLRRNGQVYMQGKELRTRQLRSGKERRKLLADLERDQ